MTSLPSSLLTSLRGASLASTLSLSNETSGLLLASLSQAEIFGCRSVRTKGTRVDVRALRCFAMPGVGPPAPAQKSMQTEEASVEGVNSRRRRVAQISAAERGRRMGTRVFQTRVRAS
jgi:hypothetical protein